MIPLLVALVGLVLVVVGWGLMQSLGPRVRIGRIIASTPVVPVATAVSMAGRPRYLGVRGRVDSEAAFEDADHRPLVYRRTRFEAERARGRWVAFEDNREAVAFEIHEGLDSIAVDSEVLGDGVVVVVRESIGTAGDMRDRAPAGFAPMTPVRLRIEQVSSVDHALVLGVPARRSDASVALTAGLGRPLVLTTLEPREAMRMVGGGRRTQAVLASVGLVAGAALVVLGLAWLLIDAVA